MLKTLPDAVLHAILTLNDAGFEAYVVGGCVRDSLMGKIPEDWDITTSATPDELQVVFGEYRCIKTGLQHGTVTVLIDGMPLEITTYRVDGDYSDGRHPDTVAFTRCLSEDLRRRDFTINAMAYHPVIGLVDRYDGHADIQGGIIRCVGEPERRFGEDALRILRALRFASVLGFSIDTNTAVALKALSPTLHRVSAERIAVEFKKLLCGKNVVEILHTYRDVIAIFCPEIAARNDFHLLSNVSPIPRSRLAALFYSAGVSPQKAETALRRLRMDNQTIRDVSLLLTDQTKSLYTAESYALHLLNRLGPELVYDYLAIHGADACTIRLVDRLLEEDACYRVSMLAVTGDDVMAAGVDAGPEVGRILQKLLDAVMEGVCANRKEDLLSYVEKIKKPVQ